MIVIRLTSSKLPTCFPSTYSEPPLHASQRIPIDLLYHQIGQLKSNLFLSHLLSLFVIVFCEHSVDTSTTKLILEQFTSEDCKNNSPKSQFPSMPAARLFEVQEVLSYEIMSIFCTSCVMISCQCNWHVNTNICGTRTQIKISPSLTLRSICPPHISCRGDIKPSVAIPPLYSGIHFALTSTKTSEMTETDSPSSEYFAR